MSGHPDDFYADVFGDGSYTTPTKWWAALGGQGGVSMDWNLPGENVEARKEAEFAEAALGQVGSSTRQELAAWIMVLTQPVRSNYATDSASMMGKALTLLAKAAEIEDKDSRQERVANMGGASQKGMGHAEGRRPMGDSVAGHPPQMSQEPEDSKRQGSRHSAIN